MLLTTHVDRIASNAQLMTVVRCRQREMWNLTGEHVQICVAVVACKLTTGTLPMCLPLSYALAPHAHAGEYGALPVLPRRWNVHHVPSLAGVRAHTRTRPRTLLTVCIIEGCP